jgi:GlpG protein
MDIGGIMRLVGEFKSKKSANRFCDFLKGQGLDSQVRQHEKKYEVWVLDNDHLQEAKQFYARFLQNPDNSVFQTSYKDRVRRERARDRDLKRHYRQYFPRPSGNQITIALIVICVLIYFISLSSLRNTIFAYLIVSLPGYPAASVWMLQPWRLFTPMFLHFSIWHILFNMFWLYDLGTLIETKDGKLFYIALILIADLGGNLLQFIISGPLFGGMSGVVYALFAYIWISSKFNLRTGYYMSNTIVYWMVGWFVLCFTGWLGPTANFGHLGGLIVGAVIAYIRKLIQDRRQYS